MMRLCLCCALLWVTIGPADGQEPGQSPAQRQDLLHKGGQYWSAPEKASSRFGGLSGGSRFWIWPAEDRVLEVRRRAPTITLAWQLRPQQRPIDREESAHLLLRFYTVSGNFWSGGTASVFSKEVHGIAAGATGGTFEVPLGDEGGEGRLLVFLIDGKAEGTAAVSNLLRITLKIVDGESGYVPPGPAMGGWTTATLATGSRTISSLSFSPDGKTLASAGPDGSILVWDVSGRSSAALSSNAHGGLTHVEFSPDGRTLVSWSRSDRRVKMWDPKARRANGEIEIGSGRAVTSVVFVPNTQVIAVLSAKVKHPFPGQVFTDPSTAEVIFWDLAEKKVTATIPVGLPIGDFAFSADGRTMATWWGRMLTIWDVNRRAPLGVALGERRGVISSVAFTADGKQLAVLDRDKTLTRVNVDDRTLITQSGLPNNRELTFVTFSDDGLRLALGGDDRAVLLWDITANAPAGAVLGGHPDGAAKGVFSSDGKRFVSGTARQLVVWELPGGNVIGRCTTEGPALPPDRWMLAISGDGRNVAIGRDDGGAVVLCRNSQE